MEGLFAPAETCLAGFESSPRLDAQPVAIHFRHSTGIEGFAVRMAACVALMALSLTMAGCKMFSKKSSDSPNPAPGASGGGTGSYPTADRTNADRTAAPVGVNGLLAGQIID